MGRRDRQKELLARYKELFPYSESVVPGTGQAYETVYGSMGKYATIIHPFKGRERSRSTIDATPPRYERAAPIQVKLPAGERWVKATDFDGPRAVIGRARARFGAAVATFDANNDGKADLFLASCVKTDSGIRDALLLNNGDGTFDDASAAFGLPGDRGSLGVAAADFDADRFVDLFLTGIAGNRLLKNDEGRGFHDVSDALKPSGPPAISLTARWLDLDQDGDLDLYVVNYAASANAAQAFGDGEPPAGVPNVAYRNDGVPAQITGSPPAVWAPLATAYPGVKSEAGLSLAFSPWSDQDALSAGNGRHEGIAALDLDVDGDIDLVVSVEGEAPVAILNDRIGRFHSMPLADLKTDLPGSGLLVTDVDRDGRPDLVQTRPQGRNSVWRNAAPRSEQGQGFALEFWPTDAHDWRSAQAIDLDLDGAFDLLGLPVAASAATLEWARDEGNTFTARPLELGDDHRHPLQGMAAADLLGNPLPDLLLIRDAEAPRIAKNLGNGNHWMSLRLGGHWRVRPEQMRTNSHALGTRLLLQGRDHYTWYDHTTPDASLAQSVGPVVLGLGPKPADATTLLHLKWPDNVMQCEMNLATDEPLTISENNRKTGSCPVLFTWNGARFVCLGDFLGGGGLGYLVAPGVVSQPDRTEAVAITDAQLTAADGLYRMAITEPMDEVAYLDHLRLDIVDRPPGVQTTPDERFAPGGNRPTGDLLAWKTAITPVKATDLNGRDVTETLARWDRDTVDGFKRLYRWIGYAEEHGVILDFGDRLAQYGANDRLILALAGWVEYPYSQTNYAAATAGVTLQPPILERKNVDGTWSVLEPDPGYPAGLPRLTTLILPGDRLGPHCVLRLRTNMELYWDQAFVAVAERDPGVKVTTLPVFHGKLGPRGYTREVSPDGRLPLIYDYNYIDPAPLARLRGTLTRFGEVTELLTADDDRLCLIGPGDELKLDFNANAVPPLSDGWTRGYVLRAFGYCKDADPFTLTGDTIGPLPWQGMRPYPFPSPSGDRPRDPAYEAYLRKYQTREVTPD